MASVAVKDHKTVGPVFHNDKELVRVKYSFADDGGVLGSTTPLILLTAGDDVVITNFWVRGITELDSAADGTSIDVGVAGGNTDVLLDGVAEATFAANALLQPTLVEGTPNVPALPLKLASAGKIEMLIVDEALNAGECEFVFEVAKFK